MTIEAEVKKTTPCGPRRKIHVVTLLSILGLIGLCAVINEMQDYDSSYMTTLGVRESLLRKLNWSKDTDPVPVHIYAFPESGITTAIHLLHRGSWTTTATNYGHAQMDKQGRIFRPTQNNKEVWEGGPVFTTNDLPEPKNSIAVRTHAAGYCLFCGPNSYVTPLNKFHWRSGAGVKFMDGRFQNMQYNPMVVKKILHFIRDPFDNAVARFYSYVGLMRARDPGIINKYPLSPSGFAMWCKSQDDKFEEMELRFLHERLRPLAKVIPCRQEFIKYAMFHNNVYQVQKKMKKQYAVVTYDDFIDNRVYTIKRVTRYLGYPIAYGNPRYGAVQGKGAFRTYYTDDQVRKIEDFLQHLVHPALWQTMKRYSSSDTPQGQR